MSKISKRGATLVRENVERPLRAMWESIEKAGIQKECQDAYSYIFKFLNEIDNEWDTSESGVVEPNIVVNGKKYTEAGK